MDSLNNIEMTEQHISKWFKNGMIIIVTSFILGIGSSIFISWRTSIANQAQIEDLQKTQTNQQEILDKKASTEMVKGIQNDLENQINNKFDAIKGQLDIVIQLSKTNSYQGKPTALK